MTVLDSIDHSPLRSRRRAAVERVALDLAVQLGYEAVTVEMICERALISPSTFFNYFGSKERAVLGAAPQPLDEARLDRFADGSGDTLTELMSMLVETWPHEPASRAMMLQRLDVTMRTPALRAAHHAGLETASDQVERAALARLQRGGAADAVDRARMIVDLSHALMHWMLDRLRIDPATPWDELVERAVSALRAVSSVGA